MKNNGEKFEHKSNIELVQKNISKCKQVPTQSPLGPTPVTQLNQKIGKLI